MPLPDLGLSQWTRMLATASPNAEGLYSALGPAVLTPLTILGFCIVAALGTVLLLPGKSVAWRRVGGGLVFAGFLVLVVALITTVGGYTNAYFWAFAIISILGSVRVITHPQPVYSALYFVLTVFSSAGLFVLCYAEFMAVALVTIYAGAILVTYTFVIMLAADAAPEETGPAGKDAAAKIFLAEHDRKASSPFVASVAGFVTMGVLLLVVFNRAPQAENFAKRMSLTDAKFMQTAPEATTGESGPVVGELATTEAGGRAVLESEVMLLESESLPEMASAGDLYSTNEAIGYAQQEGRGGIQVLGIYLFTRQMVSLQIAGLILTVAMIGAIVIARKQILPTARDRQIAAETMTSPHTPLTDNPHSLPIHGTSNPRQKAYPQN